MGTTVFNETSILFAVLIGMVVYGIRRFAEGAWPSLKTSHLWNDLVLYFLPIALGALGAWALSASGSSLLPANLSSRVDQSLWGAVAGGFSGFVYTVVRKSTRRAAGALADASEPSDKTENR